MALSLSSSLLSKKTKVMGSNNHWNAEEIFHKYLHDYLVKKNMHRTAEVFAKEANPDVCAVVSAIDSPQGFLAEWWSIFHDVYFQIQSRYVEASEESTKGKQATGTSSQNPCSEASTYGTTPQISAYDCNGMLALLSSQACEGANQKRMTRKFDSNSQISIETPSSSKLTGSVPSNSQRNPRKPAQQRQDKKRAASLGSTPMGSSTYAEPKTIGLESALNSAPLNGWPLMGANQVPPRLGNQVLNSYLQSANTQQQVDTPMSHSQQEIHAQFLANAPSKALPSFPLTSDLDIPLQNGIDRISSQNGRDEKKYLDESIEMFFSQYDEHADCINAPHPLQHPSTLMKKKGIQVNAVLANIGNFQ
ncbi:Transcriptional corepressor [Bienertia sinuspersici]